MYIDVEHLFIKKTPMPIYVNERQSGFEEKHRFYNLNIQKFRERIEMICRLLEFKKGMKILEVGAGVGIDLYELANLGSHCVDIDICPGNPEFVKGWAKNYELPIEAVKGDTCRLPFKDNCFDAVYSISTFEHITDPDSALHEQIRVLKPNGKLLIIDGNIADPRTFYDLFIRTFLKTKGKRGGLKWLLTKRRVYMNYGLGWPGKDEDYKTLWWWKRKINSIHGLNKCSIKVMTTGAAKNKIPALLKFLNPFAGMIIVLANKKD